MDRLHLLENPPPNQPPLDEMPPRHRNENQESSDFNNDDSEIIQNAQKAREKVCSPVLPPVEQQKKHIPFDSGCIHLTAEINYFLYFLTFEMIQLKGKSTLKISLLNNDTRESFISQPQFSSKSQTSSVLLTLVSSLNGFFYSDKQESASLDTIQKDFPKDYTHWKTQFFPRQSATQPPYLVQYFENQPICRMNFTPLSEPTLKSVSYILRTLKKQYKGFLSTLKVNPLHPSFLQASIPPDSLFHPQLQPILKSDPIKSFPMFIRQYNKFEMLCIYRMSQCGFCVAGFLLKQNLKIIRQFPIGRCSSSQMLALTPNKAAIFVADISDQTIRAYDTISSVNVSVHQHEDSYRFSCIKISPDGEKLAVGFNSSRARLFSITSQFSLEFHADVSSTDPNNSVTCMEFFNHYLFVGCSNGKVFCYDTSMGTLISSIIVSDNPISCLCPISDWLYVGTQDKCLSCFHIQSNSLKFRYTKLVSNSCFLFNVGSKLISVSPFHIECLSVKTGQPSFSMKLHQKQILSVFCDNKHFYSCSLDQTVQKYC